MPYDDESKTFELFSRDETNNERIFLSFRVFFACVFPSLRSLEITKTKKKTKIKWFAASNSCTADNGFAFRNSLIAWQIESYLFL